MASTIITTNADALKRAARKICAHPETLNPNHVLNTLSAAIAGPGKNWGFIQGAPTGHYVQPGLAARPAALPTWVLFVEGKGAYPFQSRRQALDAFTALAENAENKVRAEAQLLKTGAATLTHLHYAPIRIYLSEIRPEAPTRLHDAPSVRPGVPLTNEILEQLRSFLGQRRSMIVSGATRTGKTTLLGQISSGIPQVDKVVSIERSLELTLSCPKVASSEIGNEVVRDHLKSAVRMSPDWVVLGEIADPEAFTDLIEIGATGHSILGTMHAGSPASAVWRVLENIQKECPQRAASEIKAQIVETGLISLTLHRGAEGQPPRVEAASVSLDAENELVFVPIEL